MIWIWRGISQHNISYSYFLSDDWMKIEIGNLIAHIKFSVSCYFFDRNLFQNIKIVALGYIYHVSCSLLSGYNSK